MVPKNEDNQFDLEIAEKTQLSHDTWLFKFAFPNPEWVSGLPTCQHIKIFKPAAEEGGQFVARPYTPISPLNQKGSIDFVIKCYPVCEEFPNGGVLGAYLLTKNVGDKVTMEGPLGRISYKGNNIFAPKGKPERRVTKLGLIPGGSGITPLFSIMNAIYKAREEGISVKMLYSNKTVGDVLCKDLLDQINNDASVSNISVAHTLTRHEGEPPAGFLKGRVNIEMLQSLGFPEPSEETLIMICGPAAFNKHVKEILAAAGYTEEMIFG